MVEHSCPVCHLATCIHSHCEAPDLDLADVHNRNRRVRRHNIYHPYPVHIPVQAFDALLQAGQVLPALAPLWLVEGRAARQPPLELGLFDRGTGLLDCAIAVFAVFGTCGLVRDGLVYGDSQLGEDDADPCWLRKGRAMEVQAQTSDLYLQAISGGVCDASEGEVSNALDGDARENAQDGEEDKGAEVEQDDDAEDEGRIEERHCIGHSLGAIRSVLAAPKKLRRDSDSRKLFSNIECGIS